MSTRDPSRVQLDFPQLLADIIRQLKLTGTVGLLEFSDQVTPVYIVAQREGALSIDLTPIAFSSAEIVFGGLVNPVIDAVIADTGALPAGDYDIFASISSVGTIVAGGLVVVEHRDAANAVTLARLLNLTMINTILSNQAFLPLVGYRLSLNERLRVTVTAAIAGMAAGTIGARIRPTP